MRSVILGLMLCLSPAFALAATKPAPEEAQRVVDYYLHGKGMGPVLLEARFCKDIPREGEMKNECADEVSPQELKRGEAVYLWMAYMAPLGDEPQNIIVQFENGGVTRMVKNIQITGQIRYRTWLKITPDKLGAWKVKFVHDTGADTVSLGELDMTASE